MFWSLKWLAKKSESALKKEGKGNKPLAKWHTVIWHRRISHKHTMSADRSGGAVNLVACVMLRNKLLGRQLIQTHRAGGPAAEGDETPPAPRSASARLWARRSQAPRGDLLLSGANRWALTFICAPQSVAHSDRAALVRSHPACRLIQLLSAPKTRANRRRQDYRTSIAGTGLSCPASGLIQSYWATAAQLLVV